MQTNPKKILVIDDNPAIHDDFKKIFNTRNATELDQMEAAIFNQKVVEVKEEVKYIIDSAFQGQTALALVKKAIENNEPYALAFVDARMPPGWDGIQTIKKIWEVDDNIQIVICTAFADYTWQEISDELQHSDNFLILKKPFDINEIRQLVAALTKKWELRHEVQYQLNNLKTEVDARTADLALSLSLTKATLESTPEGIVVIGDHELSMFNNRFLNMWKISKEEIENKKTDEIFEYMAGQVENSEVFLKMIKTLAENNDTSKMMDLWQLKSGNIYEIHVKPQYLDNKIIGFVLSCRDITHSKKLEEQLLYQSTHDTLTELPNRILLRDRIVEGIQSAKLNKNHLAVLIVDLDNFKEINDKYGHDAGDELLKQISARLSKSTRKIDTVVRLGGDEFVVLLAELARAEDAIVKAKELLNNFSETFQVDGHTLVISVSIGISYFPEDGLDANTLLKSADAALYHAKKLGKNTFQVFMSEYNQQLLRRAELNAALIQALGKNQFILNYQPIFDINSNKIIGFEILLRWKHPSLGVIFPEKFITLAEETGLIAPIGEWVLNEACKQIKLWQEAYDANLVISVNISKYQFMQKNFVEMVKIAIDQSHILPSTLELELTESIAFETSNATFQKLKNLKKIGIRLSIDDFGMGSLNFAYLKWLSFDKIKIDKSFIKGISTNKYDDVIVESIIQMMQKLNIDIVAEGVENESQLQFLKEYKVNQVQGYFFSPPVSVDVCADFLEKQKLINEKI